MFKECEKACIYTLEGAFIAEAKVVNLEQETMGLIFEEQDVEKISPQSVIVFYDDVEGLVTCRCRLSAAQKAGAEMGENVYQVVCQIDETLSTEQRRRDLKVHVSFPVTLETGDAAGKAVHIDANAKNISVGGIGLESSVQMKENQVFSFLFENELGSARLKACILWSKQEQNEYGTPLWLYGCRFFDMTDNEEALVRKFVFQQQLKKRKTRR